ncbi:hypothetical protein ACVIHI_008321 [Bradyrhizobium sp. USDA 4524]|uniref:hypothetical protein n=1 Tax=unclassified Bradyrhizobium TaxID=2631580 RepID=UPI00209CC59A|nr:MULTISPECIES: hypothetical protein [unclassified Bradyrhizobium]MCP1838753.1 hypothetical protein [Bradyrhizobium sp. USDA 4538]MCP1899319.1 hypothetical protein [Bradyrhizobium sp. USDA 4537]MCP1986569.1 hypothetical protein [Bradyrhizobium sp. USDA 4539]
MFDITNCRDFYLKLVAEYEDFLKDPVSARVAINFALTAYHLSEWVWKEWLAADKALQAKLGFMPKEQLKEWVCRHNPLLADMRSIANGSKHFKPENFGLTAVGNDYVEPDYVESGYFEATSLLIITIQATGPEWTDFRSVAEKVVFFWREFLISYSQYRDLPAPNPSGY